MRIERKVVTKDSFGQSVESWEYVARTFASFVFASGREGFTGDRPVSQTPVVIEIRYRDWIGPEHRLVRKTTVYEVHSVEEVERRRKLRLTCSSEELRTGRG